MTVAVRYFSRSGHTKMIAEAIAAGAGVKAVSITEEPALAERADLLILGGAPYVNLMDPQLKAYAEKLTKETVGKVVLFTTANWSRRTVLTLKKMLQKKGIAVDERTFFAKAADVETKTAEAKAFGEEIAR